MSRSDQLIDAYYSPEVEALKQRAKRSLVVSLITGIFGVALFGVFGVLVFFWIVSESHRIGILSLVIGIPVFLALVVTSWIFTMRYILLSKKAKDAIDAAMLQEIENENLA